MSKSTKEIQFFNKWSFSDVKVKDQTLENYINLKPIIIPHSAGRHEHKKFWKSVKVSILERFVNRLLAPGFIQNKIKGQKSASNSGKKFKVISSIKSAFYLIELNTGNNPIQVLIDAICNTAPREETTKIAMAGISYASAVDVSPQRRVDLAIKFLVQAISTNAHNNIMRFEENLAQELILASNNNQDSKAVKRKDEVERIAVSAR